MGTKTVKRADGAAAGDKNKATPKFLLVKDAGDDGDAGAVVQTAAPATEADPIDVEVADEDWPEREDIRNGLVDQVSTRFGISQDVAIRAVNDMLRLS